MTQESGNKWYSRALALNHNPGVAGSSNRNHMLVPSSLGDSAFEPLNLTMWMYGVVSGGEPLKLQQGKSVGETLLEASLIIVATLVQLVEDLPPM